MTQIEEIKKARLVGHTGVFLIVVAPLLLLLFLSFLSGSGPYDNFYRQSTSLNILGFLIFASPIIGSGFVVYALKLYRKVGINRWPLFLVLTIFILWIAAIVLASSTNCSRCVPDSVKSRIDSIRNSSL